MVDINYIAVEVFIALIVVGIVAVLTYFRKKICAKLFKKDAEPKAESKFDINLETYKKYDELTNLIEDYHKYMANESKNTMLSKEKAKKYNMKEYNEKHLEYSNNILRLSEKPLIVHDEILRNLIIKFLEESIAVQHNFYQSAYYYIHTMPDDCCAKLTKSLAECKRLKIKIFTHIGKNTPTLQNTTSSNYNLKIEEHKSELDIETHKSKLKTEEHKNEAIFDDNYNSIKELSKHSNDIFMKSNKLLSIYKLIDLDDIKITEDLECSVNEVNKLLASEPLIFYHSVFPVGNLVAVAAEINKIVGFYKYMDKNTEKSNYPLLFEELRDKLYDANAQCNKCNKIGY